MFNPCHPCQNKLQFVQSDALPDLHVIISHVTLSTLHPLFGWFQWNFLQSFMIPRGWMLISWWSHDLVLSITTRLNCVGPRSSDDFLLAVIRWKHVPVLCFISKKSGKSAGIPVNLRYSVNIENIIDLLNGRCYHCHHAILCSLSLLLALHTFF